MYSDFVSFSLAEKLYDAGWDWFQTTNRYAITEGIVENGNDAFFKVRPRQLFSIPFQCYFEGKCVYAPTYGEVLEWFLIEGIVVEIIRSRIGNEWFGCFGMIEKYLEPESINVGFSAKELADWNFVANKTIEAALEMLKSKKRTR